MGQGGGNVGKHYYSERIQNWKGEGEEQLYSRGHAAPILLTRQTVFNYSSVKYLSPSNGRVSARHELSTLFSCTPETSLESLSRRRPPPLPMCAWRHVVEAVVVRPPHIVALGVPLSGFRLVQVHAGNDVFHFVLVKRHQPR